MKKSFISTLPFLFSLAAANAASITWTSSPGLLDTEVSKTGAAILGYYFSPNTALPATVAVNGVNFARSTSTTAPAGLDFGGGFNNPEDVDCYQVPASAGNAGLNAIMDGQNWGGAGKVDITNLVVGQKYQVQYFLSDDRTAFLNARHYALSDGPDAFGARDIEYGYHSTRGGPVPAGAPAGSVASKIYTGAFTADTATQSINTWLYGAATGHDAATGNAGSQVNAIQLRLVPEPSAAMLGLASLGMLFARRRR